MEDEATIKLKFWIIGVVIASMVAISWFIEKVRGTNNFNTFIFILLFALVIGVVINFSGKGDEFHFN